MKKILLILVLCSLLLAHLNINAQNWVNGGNNLPAIGKLGTTSNQSLSLITAGTERARITNTGNFGIGTASPITRLHVNGFGSFGSSVTTANATRVLNLVDKSAVMRIIRVDATLAPAVELISRTSADGANVSYWDLATQPVDASFRIRDRTTGPVYDRITITHAGNVGIGTTTPLAKLHVEPAGNGGGIYAEGNDGIAVHANSFQGIGVYAYSETAYGVRAECPQGTGIETSGQVYGIEASGDEAGVNCFSTDGVGLDASSTNSSGLVASTSGGTYAAEFNGKVFASGGYITSDKNLKQNIHEFGDAISIINKLKPRNYEFKNDSKFEFLHLPKGIHYGLIAQDLEQVLPNLVSEGKHTMRTFKPATPVRQAAGGSLIPIVAHQQEPKESITIKAVNYVELIPIMIKAMQEQEATIEKQNTKIEQQNANIEQLTQLVNKLSQNPATFGSVKLKSAFLGQNTPNPNSTSTRISYNIPTGFLRAELVVNNANGQKVKQVQLNKSGFLDLDTSSLTTGTYFYTLFVNGTSVDTKKMVVNR